MQIALKAVKQNKRPKYIKFRRKISKTDQKPPNLHKTQVNYLKPSIPIKTAQIQYNIIIKPHKQDKLQKNCF